MTRSEARRGGRDRWAEARRVVRAAARGMSSAQRRYALLLGAMCALALALILRWGSPPSPWRVGDRPASDVDARVGYQVPDLVAQGDLERKAADATPNVYRRDDADLLAVERDLKQVLTAAKSADGARAPAADVLGLRPPTEDEFQALKAALPADRDIGQLMADVHKLLVNLADALLIARARKKVEVGELRERIVVLSEDGRRGTPYPRDLVMVAEEAEALEGVLLSDTAADFGSGEGGRAFKRAVAGYIARRARPNLFYDADTTAHARQAAAATVGPVVRLIQPGQVIAKRGRPITPEVLAELEREHAAYLAAQSAAEPPRRTVATVGLALLLAALTGGLLWRIEPRIIRSKPRLFVFGLLCVLVAAVARALQVNAWPIFLAPVALVVIALAIAYNQRVALGSAFILSLLAALATTGRLETLLVFLVGSAVGALGTREVRNRARLIEVGFAVGLSYAVTIWVMGLLNGSAAGSVAGDSLWGLASGVMTGFVITGGLPFIEMLFKITTDISLLELSGANQRLLRRLALEAPGTYNHSLVVGSLAEAAAEAVGANGLVARLGSLFHDVGKTTKPEYFVENRTGSESRHERLTPRMSALVIIAHVKNGLEMAREHRLPRVIRDVIAEHHGTTLVEYFYDQAQRQHAAKNGREPDSPPEAGFRYPGPRPRSREAAIVMLADAVESASRSMREPTPARIESLVSEIARRRMDEGQFDDCALTFTELATIQATLTAALARIYHSRVRYPGQDELEGTAGEKVRSAAAEQAPGGSPP